MTTQDIKATFRNIVEEIFNNKKLALIDEYVASDMIDHSAPPGLPPGIEGYRLKLGMFTNAFPDLHLAYDHLIVEGDMVAGRFTLTGTQQGDFAGIPATGKQVSVTGHDFGRVVDGKLVEHWVEMNTLGMMQQLGVIPSPEAT
jgi:predicted ester cyclase